MTVFQRPPEIVMPVPTGPWAAEPAAGTSALLLSWTLLFWKTQHEAVFVSAGLASHWSKTMPLSNDVSIV